MLYTPILVATLACSCPLALAQSVVDSYISTEEPIAKAGLLANIGPDGSKSSGAAAGVVVASPSTTDPDYVYTWTRDSSLVFKVIADMVTLGSDTSLRGLLDDFVGAETLVQQITNPSGTVSTGGLGEPKFYVNQTAFLGSWGRPQRDGPALRSTTLITYANWLLDTNNSSYVSDTLWPVIRLDLDYVAQNWNRSTFDLWEEVSSSSFFTTAVQHRALRQGSALASRIGQTSSISNYDTQAANLLCFLQSYWNPTGYISANTGGGRSGIDANTVLTSIHTFDIGAGCDSATFQPCSDKALSNLKVYVDAFRSIYSINSGLNSTAPVATGRYPEDVYYNGNPWYLATLAVAEQLYDALLTWSSLGALEVTSTSLAFFQQFDSSATVGTYESTTGTYTALTVAIKAFADGMVGVVATYTPSGGGLSEQFDKATGSPVSAADLTWSYASALTAFAARAGTVPASWGASGLTVPTTCSFGPQPVQIPVNFNVEATTAEGENIYLTGSVDALKNWSPTDALLMSSASYPTWSLTVNLSASTNIEYKYIRIQNGAVTWESDPNNQISTPANETYTLNDTWR